MAGEEEEKNESVNRLKKYRKDFRNRVFKNLDLKEKDEYEYHHTDEYAKGQDSKKFVL